MPDSGPSTTGATPRGTITLLLDAIARGHPEKEDELYLVVYRELHDLAAAAMKRERDDHSLQTTALIHEVYLRLMTDDSSNKATTPTFANRRHFFASAARAMRRILVEHARRKQARDATPAAVPVLPPTLPGFDRLDLLALDEALGRLEKRDERMCRIVELRFFAQMTIKQIARILGVTTRTIDRDWKAARTWLHREM